MNDPIIALLRVSLFSKKNSYERNFLNLEIKSTSNNSLKDNTSDTNSV